MDATSTLQGVSNALSVLEVLAARGPELGVADVGRYLGIPRSTAYRLLSVLVSRGYVEQHPITKKYRLGLKIFELAGEVSRNLGLREIAFPLLERLAQETDETVHLAILDRGESVVIEKVDSSREVYLRSHVGARRPLYCTAIGKALLAFQSPEWIDDLIARGLRRFTGSTVVDPQALRLQLEEVRKKGFSVNWGEYREEGAGVAAPVRDRTGRVVASIGIAAPINRMNPERAEELGARVVRCADSISKRLGWWPSDRAVAKASLPGAAETAGV